MITVTAAYKDTDQASDSFVEAIRPLLYQQLKILEILQQEE